MTLPRELFKDIVGLLESYADDSDKRKALFLDALYGEKILAQINWDGSAAEFTRHAVQRLDQHGYCENGDHTVARLLKEFADKHGVNVGAAVQALLIRLRDHLEAAKNATIAQIEADPGPYPPTTAQNVPPEKPETVQTWRLALRVVAILLFVVGIAWLVSTPGFEPLLALLGGVATMLTTISQPAPRVLNEKGRQWWQFWQRDNDAELLDRLQKSWIEGFLYRALRDVKQFVIRAPLKTDAVLRHKDVAKYDLRSTADIWAIYHIFDEHLLILGDPGAGKTILMLQLAEMLLKQAKDKPGQRLPVVFNLASWARTQKPLHDWLIDEFKTFYRVGPKVARQWLTNQRLIVMLDGLDEVKEEARPACVEAINAFRTSPDFPGIRMVVCSRIKDYEALRVRLNLDGAITLQPLEAAAVDKYLADQGKEATGLVEAIAADPTLRDMSLIPFLLNTMVYTYKGASAALIGVYPDAAERREKLFERYVGRRLDDSPSPYGYARTLKYLRWLAKKMMAYTQTVFRPADIEPYWLDEGRLKGRLANYLFPMRGGTRRYLRGGFSSFIQRILVRLWLIRRDYLPVQVTRFLRAMQDRQIMRPLSGGHVFLHRYLLESLAGRDEIMILIGQLGNEATRTHAETVLLRIGEPAIKPLFAEVVDPQGRIHAGALDCLLNIGEKSVEPLAAKFRERADTLQIGPLLRSTHPLAEKVITGMGEAAIVPAIKALTDEATRAHAEQALIRIGEPAHKLLISPLHEGDPKQRAEWGRLIASIDPRPGVLDFDIQWCDVPPGPFQMGGDPDAYNEWDGQQITLHYGPYRDYRYWVAPYPVTYAQYAQFVADGGYTAQHRDCWTDAGWDWKKDKQYPESYWNDPQWHIPNHPVVGVTWYESYAFAAWVEKQRRAGRLRVTLPAGVPAEWVIRLPTEAEWEKAARWPDGRKFPWGDTYTSGDANIDEKNSGVGEYYLQCTSAVGLYRKGGTGAYDQSGNVWEWLLSEWASAYRYPEANGAAGTARRGLRGGSWYFNQGFARAAARLRLNPDGGNGDWGLRLFCAVPVSH